MSLPPQILRIKRKRLDEPVDALYIEAKGDRKRRHTQHDFVFRRLLDEQEPTRQSNGLPQILATQPGDEIKYERANHKDVVRELAGSDRRSIKNVMTPQRRFHLSRAALTGSQSPATLRKRRRKTESPHIAVFVEDSNDVEMDVTDASRELSHQVGIDLAAPSPARKRPGATLKSTKNTAIARDSTANADLEEKNSAIQQAMEKHAQELDDAQAPASDPPAATVNYDDAMDTSEDYVYDTYERCEASPSTAQGGSRLDETGKAELPTGLIGYLVISEEDQPLWETFYDSDAHSSDERDWDSEQDDENAENYYGADYPEEEVDSADEYGQDAYRYRKGSDDEQFGSDEESSDEEGKPWKKTLRDFTAKNRAVDEDSDDDEADG